MRTTQLFTAALCALVLLAAGRADADTSSSSSSSSSFASSSSGTGGFEADGVTCAGNLVVSAPSRVHPRSAAQLPDVVSYADCASNVRETFSVSLAAPVSGHLEVWATTDGADCAAADRAAEGCVELAAAPAVPSLQALDTRDIADLVSTDCVASSGTGLPSATTLYFIVVTGAGVDASAACTFTGNSVDLAGPAAPTGVVAGIGDGALFIDYDASVDEDAVSYSAFCDDGSGAPAAGGAAGAGGAGADGGAGGAPTRSLGDCHSDFLNPGEIPDPAYRRGSPSKGDQVVAKGLKNGVLYACGVAAIDAVGNAGPLSQLSCAPPEPTEDFYTRYLREGGAAGCQLGAATRPAAPAFAISLALAAAILARRRMRYPRSA